MILPLLLFLVHSGGALSGWDRKAIPPDAAFQALVTDLNAIPETAQAGVLARRLNNEVSGARLLIMYTYRAKLDVAALSPSQVKDALLAQDPRWTPDYLLTSLDLKRDAQGDIVKVGPEEAAFSAILLRTFSISAVLAKLNSASVKQLDLQHPMRPSQFPAYYTVAGNSSFQSYPIPGWSLRWYQELFASDDWARATRNSLIVAPLATLIAPMVVPIVVVGVCTYLFFANIGLSYPYTGLVLVHPALGAPFVVTTVLATLQSFNQNLFKASLRLGARPVQTTLPRQMFTGIRENISPTIAAVATLLILFTAALMGVLKWLRGRVKK